MQESIAHGIPCIASSGGALPEAGAGLAVSFNPADTEGLKKAMARWITDDGALAEARVRIAQGFVGRQPAHVERSRGGSVEVCAGLTSTTGLD